MISFESKFNLYIFLAILIALLMVVCIFIQIIIIKKILRSDKEDVIDSKKNKSELMVKSQETSVVTENIIDMPVIEEKAALDTHILTESAISKELESDQLKSESISNLPTYDFIEQKPKPIITLKNHKVSPSNSQNQMKAIQKTQKKLNSFSEEQHATSRMNDELDGEKAMLNEENINFIDVDSFVKEQQPKIETVDQTVNLSKDIELKPSFDNDDVNLVLTDETKNEESRLIEIDENDAYKENLNNLEMPKSSDVQNLIPNDHDKTSIEKNKNFDDTLIINIEKKTILSLESEKRVQENESDEVIIFDSNDDEVEEKNINQIEELDVHHIQKTTFDNHKDTASIEKNINHKDALTTNIDKKTLLDLGGEKKAQKNKLDEVLIIDSNDDVVEEDSLEIKEVIHLDNDDSIQQVIDDVSSEEISEEDEFDDYSHLLIKPIPISIKRNEAEDTKPLILASEIHSELLHSELDTKSEVKNTINNESLAVVNDLNDKVNFGYTTIGYHDKFLHNKDIINVKNIVKDVNSKTVINEMSAAVNRMTSLDTKKEFDFKKILDTYQKMSDMYK
jgi:hypothetical protein